MIRRTVLEWESIAYGDGPDQIPVQMADRLAAVAAASSHAGRNGNGVVEHGRRGLRAKSIVGVVAADGCLLEILPKIDVNDGEGVNAPGAIRRRLVHMVAIALDLKIDVGQVTALEWQPETLLEILIRLFSERLADALRQASPDAMLGTLTICQFYAGGSTSRASSRRSSPNHRGWPASMMRSALTLRSTRS